MGYSWVTPYKYNGDRNAIPLEHMRVVVESNKSASWYGGDYGDEYIAYVWGEELDISCTGEEPVETVERMLTALESLGYEGTVEVDNYDGKQTYELGKTEHYYTTFRHITIGEE